MASSLYGSVYCGAPALPGTLGERFNLDPVLIAALAAIALLHLVVNRRAGQPLAGPAARWAIAAAA